MICFLAAAVYACAADAVTVYVDPATGKVRQPTPADIEKLAAAAQTRTTAKEAEQEKPLDLKYGPGGAVGVKLGASSRSYMVVTRTPDGKLSTDCVTGEKAAEKAVSGAK